jgi:hypothetical protein
MPDSEKYQAKFMPSEIAWDTFGVEGNLWQVKIKLLW